MKSVINPAQIEQTLTEHYRQGNSAKWGWLMVILGFVGFILWAAFAPLDNGVALPGTVVVSGERKSVEAVSSGLIQQVYVKDGTLVLQNQLLLAIDPTLSQNTVASLGIQQQTLHITLSRLQAEQTGQSHIEVAEQIRNTSNPEVRTALAAQQQLFISRQLTLHTALQGILSNIEGQQALLSGLDAALSQKKAQRHSYQIQLASLRELAMQGYIAKNRLLEQERAYAQLQSEIAHDIGIIGQTKRQIADLQYQYQQRRQLFLQEVNDEIANTQLQAAELSKKLHSAEFELAHHQIRAPAAGIVMGLNVHNAGATLTSGQKIMDIFPANQPLLVEGYLPVNQIDRVQSGLEVDLLFSAFNQSTTPKLSGRVSLVSADRLVHEKTGEPYYKLQVHVDADQLKKLAHQQIVAGMPVEIFVKTGERTLLNYLFKPLLDRSKTAWGDA
jgi:protease secretion system membrane fusion protein